MSTTIDSLEIQIKTSAGSSATNIGNLANSLSKLNKNANLTKVTNNLERLSKVLGELQTNSTGLSSIRELASAVKSMSTISDPKGLKGTITSLKKLGEFTNGLDDKVIDSFTVKIRKLADALEPLATRINAVATGFNKLPSQVSKTVTAVNRMERANAKVTASTKSHGVALDRQGINMAAMVTNAQAYIDVFQQVRQTLTPLVADAIEWDGIQFRFGRAFGEDAEEVYAYAQKINDVLGINLQQFMQYSSMYGSLLSGFGLAQEKVTTISVGLTELSYDIWAAYNDRYKTLEDASEAVRSAITGEIEPIRNAGIALTEASMQEYLDSIGKAHIRMQNLTEAQKAEVRYATMVNAALNQGIVGTYAKEINTAEGAVRNLTQQLKSLGQAMGSLFLPILTAVVPWISAFVELLYEAVAAVAAFFNIPFFKISWGESTKGIGGIAGAAKDAETALGGAGVAAKKLKDYTMGFDELNVISPDAGGAGGGGAGVGKGGWGEGLDLDTLWDDSVFASVSKQVDDLKAKIRDYMEEHKTLIAVVGSVAAFLGFMKILRGLNSLFGVTKTVDNLKTAFKSLRESAKNVKSFGTSIKDFFKTAKQMAPEVGWLKALFPKSAMTMATVSQFLSGTLLPAFKKGFATIPRLLANAIRAIPVWGWVVSAIIGVITLALVDFDFTDFGYKVGYAIGTALKWAGKALLAVGGWINKIGDAIFDGLESAVEWVKTTFEIDSVLDLFMYIFNPKLIIQKLLPELIKIGSEVLPGIWQGIKDGWNNFWGNIKEFIGGFVQGFKDALGIKSPSKVFAEIGVAIIEGLISGISAQWEELKRWFDTTIAPKFTLTYWVDTFEPISKAITTKLTEFKAAAGRKWTEIKSWYNGNVAPKLTLTYWLNQFGNFKNGFVQTVKNMLNTGIELINRFIGWLNDKMKFEWDSFEVGGKELVEAGKIQLFTIPLITQRFADGGFIEDGLFTMNHGEIAGRFSNGKSVVANNEQIVEGIATGVYRAVVQAMSETQSGGQPVNVYLDGKQIYTSVKRHEAERGLKIMGSQLGYSY